MTETLSLPVLGLENEFPDTVYLLHHVPSGKYGCYCHQEIHGVASFSTEESALGFSTRNDLFGMSIVEMSFDEAREVAKARPMPVVCLMLLDRLDDPKIHWVR